MLKNLSMLCELDLLVKDEKTLICDDDPISTIKGYFVLKKPILRSSHENLKKSTKV